MDRAPETRPPLALAVLAQTSFRDARLASARAAVDDLVKLLPSDDVQHNAAIIHALEGEMRPITTNWHGVLCTAIGYYVRGDPGAACACVVEAERAQGEERCEERDKARAVALAAAELVHPPPRLPFAREDIREEGTHPERGGEGAVARSWRAVFEGQEGGRLAFSLWPHCTRLPQALRERAAAMLAPGCSRRQLVTLSRNGLASLAAVSRARELGDEGLALSILSSCPHRPQHPAPDTLIDAMRASLSALHQPRTRVKASKTGHQGAAADRTTSATALPQRPAVATAPKRCKGRK